MQTMRNDLVPGHATLMWKPAMLQLVTWLTPEFPRSQKYSRRAPRDPVNQSHYIIEDLLLSFPVIRLQRQNNPESIVLALLRDGKRLIEATVSVEIGRAH